VSGACFFSSPLPIVGNNANVSYGLTAAYVDVADAYVMQNVNATHYMHDGEAVAYNVRTEHIAVLDQASGAVTVRSLPIYEAPHYGPM
ncbi:penicillin acylase family protein, partial [Salmonella enterica]|uniref:penicillin acylase family protein n=1 Tax=Salmonella enterica TaxID=28901 RepID=UPI0032967E30